MKLWLDDIREAPIGWVWAKTANKAIELLATGDVTQVSLDHDLSFEHYGSMGDTSCFEKTGYDVVCWMEENNVWPEKIHVHSMNPVGKAKMEQVIKKSAKPNRK